MMVSKDFREDAELTTANDRHGSKLLRLANVCDSVARYEDSMSLPGMQVEKKSL